MKTSRFLIATGLSLTALVTVLSALAWGQLTIVQAERPLSPAVPLILPLPYLSAADAADAPYGPAPVVEGHISPGEYAVAHKLTFPTYGGNLEVLIRQDAITLYIAFDSADTTPYPYDTGQGVGPAFQVFLDTRHDRSSLPRADDYRLTIRKNGSTREDQGTVSGGWGGLGDGRWTAASYTTTWGWQSEFAISLSKLNITTTGSFSIGLAVAEVWTPAHPKDWYWPSTGFYANPSTWGRLTSSSQWGTFYWKPGPWQDYAPSGMPDLDQKQPGWQKGGTWTHCGPAAVANSLWWFDSKMETPDHAPPVISDTYPLVKSYGAWDDHDISNTVPLVNDLSLYFRTNQGLTGTSVISMFYGLQSYLRDHNLWDDYIVTLVPSPTFQWVTEETLRSEDVILLLGFWEWVDPSPIPGDEYWARVGGHFVTVAGADPAGRTGLSDPYLDATEMGLGMILPGRVLSGTLLTHYPPHPGPVPIIHNDAGNVSHDVYPLMPTNSPGGVWGPGGYPWFDLLPLLGANPHPAFPIEPWHGGPLQVEVEFALTVSPYTWKASGYQDYAPNGLPDFDQKQDNWKYVPIAGAPQWSFCGPVAAANSLWWFDSKFEPRPVTPITLNDNYPLVQFYPQFLPITRDDHDPLNVDNPNTPWPPGGILPPPPIQPGQGEFVEDLALYFQTDQLGSGTVITNIRLGLEQYLTNHRLRQGYVITQVKSPEFWWVAEEVERSEDVILLLGFWQNQSTGPVNQWVRLGGHYVTLPGVDKQGGWIAFSDPFLDRIEKTWPFAGISKPLGWPAYLGRVASGVLTPHQHPDPGVTHNDAGNISHDVYRVITTTSPGGIWGPEGYVLSWSEAENFWGQNGQNDTPTVLPRSIETEVEWALATSPVADVWISKTVTPTLVRPGQWVTLTLTFGNAGNTAENVVISDVLPARLLNASYTYTLNYSGTLTGYDTFTWTVGTLRWSEGGLITITARVDPSAAWPVETSMTNTVEITTTTQEQYQVKQLPDKASASFKVQTADLSIVSVAAPAFAVPGDPVTFTTIFSNVGMWLADNVVLTDALPSGLSSVGTSVWLSNQGSFTFHADPVYWWELPDLARGDWGIITITANINPNTTWPPSTWLTNVVTITTSSIEAVPGQSNLASAGVTIRTADLNITKTVIPTGTLANGQWLTFTLAYSNAGPAAASHVVITDLLSSKLLTATAAYTFTTSYGAALAANDHFVWQVGTVPAGCGGMITITAHISNALGTSLLNQTLITGWFDRDPSNNQAAITVPLSGSTVYLPVVMRN